MLDKLKSHKKELLILAILLLITGIAHGYNMFHYPYYENDEGTYMSQAWAIIHQGKLAPYTYFYDHAPFGWILIGLWTLISGGFFTFGLSVNSGRFLMLILHVLSVLLLYLIALKTTKSKTVATISALIFALSPLGLSFERRVLLDNIMVFWVLFAYYLVLAGNKLRFYILSAVSFALAVLSKETAIFFIPVFLFVIYYKAHKHHRAFAVMQWLSISLSIISFYFLYALLKGEFFASGTLYGGSQPHVSIVETFAHQLSRTGGFFLNPSSGFMLNFKEWISGGFFIPVPDAPLIIGGIISTIFLFLLSFKNKRLLFICLPSIAYWAFLIRGGEVIGFYIIPAIPFLALNIGVSVNIIASYVSKLSFGRVLKLPLLVILLLPLIFYYLTDYSIYKIDQTTPQIEALDWVLNNIPQNSNVLIDNYAYVDFHDHSLENKYDFNIRANYYWKADTDPDIKIGLLKGDWRNIDYIMVTPQIKYDVLHANLPILKEAYDNSTVVKTFVGNKWDLEIRKVNSDPSKKILLDSWNFYKGNYIKSYGQIINPGDNDVTTSEGQSYAMLRAVWSDDKGTFDGVWAWTKDHLQYRPQDKLFSWQWVKKGSEYKLGDFASASDADEDIALALLFAYKRWGDISYFSTARVIIDDIWEKEVVKVNGHYYLTSGTGAERDDGYLINPSYLSPATYRIFAEVDTKHPWIKLTDDSYYLLNKLAKQKDNPTKLPSNWVLINKETGEVKSVAKYIQDKDVDAYGFDAFRTMWRVALDAVWFQEPNAIEYLREVEPFFIEQWKKDGKFVAIYNLSGTKRVPYSAVSTDTGVLSIFAVINKTLAKDVYSKLYDSKFKYDFGYWGDKNNYYDQNWAWFGTALYSGNLPNLWRK